jgi:hypothetical protein
VLSQDGARVSVALAEGDCLHPGSFESETESADPAEEVEDIQPCAPRSAARARAAPFED